MCGPRRPHLGHTRAREPHGDRLWIAVDGTWTPRGRHVDRARIEKLPLSGSGIVSFESQSPRERQDQGRGHPIAPSFRKIHPPTVNPSRRRTPRHEILASWGISLIGAIFGLWHENGEEYESYDGNRCKVEKSRRVAIPLYDESRCQLTQARADADSQRDKTLRKIEATCAAHQVGSDEDCDDAENPRGNSIEHLDSDNAVNSKPRIGKIASATRKMLLRPKPELMARPTPHATPPITNCAIIMQADKVAASEPGCDSASTWPAIGSIAAFPK